MSFLWVEWVELVALVLDFHSHVASSVSAQDPKHMDRLI